MDMIPAGLQLAHEARELCRNYAFSYMRLTN